MSHITHYLLHLKDLSAFHQIALLGRKALPGSIYFFRKLRIRGSKKKSKIITKLSFFFFSISRAVFASHFILMCDRSYMETNYVRKKIQELGLKIRQHTLILLLSVKIIAKRSIPIPQPAVGGKPYSSAVQKFSSIICASSSPACFC